MKKYYCITFLALFVITLLQGYNIFLQYTDYIHNETDKINTVLKVALDKEFALRAHTMYNPHKDGVQRLYYKEMTYEDLKKAAPPKEDILDLTEINVQDLRDRGIVETEADAMGLLTKDRLTAKGMPINLSKLSQIFKKNLEKDFSCSFFIIDEEKKVIQSYGKAIGIEYWQSSNLIAIGLAPVRFIKVMVNIPPSSFVINSTATLLYTIFLAMIIVFCIGYQMTVIKSKEKLLKDREISIHGTIHDLKAPLASVLLSLSFIKDEIKDIELKEILIKTEKQTKALVYNIKMILVTAKAGENKLALNKEATEILVLVNQAKELIETNYAIQQPIIKIHDERTNKENIHADSFLIGNAIYNLMENAVKYSVKEAHIEVSITDSQRFVLVSIKDYGIGIDKKYQKKIFEQFYRIPNTQHKNGYGIGLAMVKYAIKAHGGTIKVESQLGKGSTFTFTLPKK